MLIYIRWLVKKEGKGRERGMGEEGGRSYKKQRMCVDHSVAEKDHHLSFSRNKTFESKYLDSYYNCMKFISASKSSTNLCFL
jgi:hypothetical protein